jgi:hypothetical protein
MGDQGLMIKNFHKGPTTLLGTICAPLNHYFIFRIFLESFKYVIKKYSQIVLLVSKLL